MVLRIVSLEEIGEELGRIRKKAKGLSQREIARITKMSLAHICQLENGKSIDTKELLKLEKALGIKISILISTDENDIVRLMQP